MSNQFSSDQLLELLESKYLEYNQKSFIEADPISIPHGFTAKQDIEIAGFWTAILSWGQRKTILNKAKELFDLMDNAPYDFIINSTPKDFSRFKNFKHRTFQYPDTLCFLDFLKKHFQANTSLETAFVSNNKFHSIEMSLDHFRNYFFEISDHLDRTKKHVSAPFKKSTCKRLNMFLRWMVRKDNSGVDFGIWHKIEQSKLMIPFDVHVERVARNLGLLKRKQRDWKAVLEVTEALQKFDSKDPVKYDFALFGMGILDAY